MRPWRLARFVWRGLQLNRLSRAEPAVIAALQRRRLQALVRLAVARSPFYRDKFAHLSLDHFELGELPPTNKQEVMAHFEDVLTVRDVRQRDLQQFMAEPKNVGSYFQGRYVLSHTSGSQGQPIIVVQNRSCMEQFFLLQMTRGNASGKSGLAETLRNARHPTRLAAIILKRGFYPSCTIFSYPPAEVSAFVTICPLSMTDPDLVEKVNDFRPTVVAGFANVLGQLASEAEEGRLRISATLRHIVNHSETLSLAAWQRLHAVFGVPVLNNYATAECNFLSNGCPTDPGAHINADWCIVEVVDEHSRPVPAGVQGERILVTNLANTVQPFIRYEIEDRVTLAANPCQCGNRLPRILDIDGRRSADFWVQDGARHHRLSAFVFKKAFLHVYEVREWQAVQRGPNAFTLRLEVLPGATLNLQQARQSVAKHLELYGFDRIVDFDLEVVPTLGPDPATGKFKQVIPMVASPEYAV